MLKYNSFRVGLALLIGAVLFGGLMPIILANMESTLGPLTFVGNSAYVLAQPAAVVGSLLIAGAVAIDYFATGGVAGRGKDEVADDEFDGE